MTKQQMAEWLAENVLGWEKAKKGYWYTFKGPDNYDVVGFIYSPDGFFAVLKAFYKAGFRWSIDYMDHETWNDSPIYPIISIETGELVAEVSCKNPEDEPIDYEAFYKSVYEAMK